MEEKDLLACLAQDTLAEPAQQEVVPRGFDVGLQACSSCPHPGPRELLSYAPCLISSSSAPQPLWPCTWGLPQPGRPLPGF